MKCIFNLPALFVVLFACLLNPVMVNGQTNPNPQQVYTARPFPPTQYKLTGKLETNSRNNTPVANARVMIVNGQLNAITGSDGSFAFTVTDKMLDSRVLFTVGRTRFETVLKNESSWKAYPEPYVVSFYLQKISVIRDRDNDGIPDEKDKCPGEAGVERYMGCPVPDSDGDGINDDNDKCPRERGTSRHNGCPAPDTDGDGINDDEDKCPRERGSSRYNGCPVPDSDGDGINDDEDKCPRERGSARYNGCPAPDTDGDGIIDDQDKCPRERGSSRYAGCPVPDTDGDGLNDEEDKCPTQRGERNNNGCPVLVADRDGDGINDALDKCPGVAGVERYSGCPVPDTDGDKINDEEDKCPEKAGPASNNGCPLAVKARYTFKANNKVVVRRTNDESNWTVKRAVQKSLVNERIIPTASSEKIIEKLNPGYKEKIASGEETELILPTFPETGETREEELANEFEGDEFTDSAGIKLFIEKSHQFSKLLKTSLVKIDKVSLLDKLYNIDLLMSKAAAQPNLLLKKYETDILNAETGDFYDYYLELALQNNLQNMDTAYLSEFQTKITKILNPALQKASSSGGTRGPKAGFDETVFDDAPDPRLMVFFYVYTPELVTPKDSFWIYTLSKSQYDRLLAQKISFSSLEKPTAKCQYPANVTAKPIDFSFTWYVVAVKRNAPSVIVAMTPIDAESILVKPDRPEINERYAVALFMDN